MSTNNPEEWVKEGTPAADWDSETDYGVEIDPSEWDDYSDEQAVHVDTPASARQYRESADVSGAPSAQQPVDAAAAEEPTEELTEEPVAEEPKTVAEEPAVEESVAEEPVADEPVVEESVADGPAAEEPLIEEPTEALTRETAAEDAVVEEPSADAAVDGEALREPFVAPVVERRDHLAGAEAEQEQEPALETEREVETEPTEVGEFATNDVEATTVRPRPSVPDDALPPVVPQAPLAPAAEPGASLEPIAAPIREDAPAAQEPTQEFSLAELAESGDGRTASPVVDPVEPPSAVEESEPVVEEPEPAAVEPPPVVEESQPAAEAEPEPAEAAPEPQPVVEESQPAAEAEPEPAEAAPEPQPVVEEPEKEPVEEPVEEPESADVAVPAAAAGAGAAAAGLAALYRQPDTDATQQLAVADDAAQPAEAHTSVIDPAEAAAQRLQAEEAQEQARLAQLQQQRDARDARLGIVGGGAVDAERVVTKPVKRQADRFLGAFSMFVFRTIVAGIIGILGYQVLQDVDAAAQFLSTTVIPEPRLVAWILGFGLVSMAVLLFLGFGARIWAGVLLLVAIGSLVTVRWGNFSIFQPGMDGFLGDRTLLTAGAALVILAFGAGRFSIDGAIHSAREKAKFARDE